jgi:protein-S-isoprenylcysteine O-methyltransferase Ste14
MAAMTKPRPLASLELKIPPPVVALVTGALMWLMVSMFPFAAFAVPGQTAIALCLALAGIMIDVVGFLSFRQAHTTANPITPGATTVLVTIGLYKYTRNPMYAGLLLVLFGWATFLSNALCFALVPLAALYLTRFQISPEEQVLIGKFGAEYADYQARVRRWF